MDDGWTVGELTARVADALAGDGVRAPNGRVRDLPDARAIRWYATIGLVDRPLPVPGRSARYGTRHLLQLVAVKRRQAQGRTLAQIQAELTGATDETLGRIAQVPEEILRCPRPAAPAPEARPRPRFWAADTAPAASVPEEPELTLHPLPRRVHEPREPALAVTYQLALPGGVTLGLPRAPAAGDLAAILAASAGLLTVLATRDLLAAATDTDDPTLAVLPIHEGDAR